MQIDVVNMTTLVGDEAAISTVRSPFKDDIIVMNL